MLNKTSAGLLYCLSLPFPPSVNTYWRAPNKGPLAGRHLISMEGRKFRSDSLACVLVQLRTRPQAIAESIAVDVVLYPPDARKRDLDNYLKAVLDALTHAGIWHDDSQIKHLTVSWGGRVDSGATVVYIDKYQQLH